MRERRQPRGRAVRQRMLIALLVCAATVLAAGTPGVTLAVQDLSAAQQQVTDTRLATRATLLGHALADERDDLAVSAARDRTAAAGGGLPEADRARTDRQLADLTADAPAALRSTLATLPAVRLRAFTGTGGPRAVVTAYQPLVDALGRVAGPGTAPIGRAAGAAAVQRALLVGALTGSGAQSAPVADAQAARVQEQAALAEFRATASAALRARYDRTVTGADAAQAEHDLTILLDQPRLTGSDRALGAGHVMSALTARIGLIRSVAASAAADEARTATAHRRHQATVLELRAALAGLCLLLLVVVLVTLFRSLTRPLAALHRWSRTDPERGQGAEVTGADEFAAVARRVNALTHEAQALRVRVRELTAERTTTLGVQTTLAAEREALLRTQDDLLRSRDDVARQLTDANARNAVHVTYVNLGLRTLGLVERQLALIESLEGHEEDPDRLETLFKLDHLATRMRRNSENLLVLAGTEHSHGASAHPVVLVDVARAAISEIEPYERVRIQAVPEARVASRAADDIGHLVAELLDNAAAFSAPAAEIILAGRLLDSGEVMLSVEDTGIGVPPGRLDDLNALLAEPDPAPPGTVSGMGLYVVARLARRHGVRVWLRPQPDGGTAAVVVLPQLLLSAVDPEEPPTTPLQAALAGGPGRTPGPDHRPAAPPEHSRPATETGTASGTGSGIRSGTGSGIGSHTPKGLPQRVPGGTTAGGEPAVRERPQGAGAVDPEEVRRRLGALQRGLRAGRRDAEQEFSGQQPDRRPPGAQEQRVRPEQQDRRRQRAQQGDTGNKPGTVEEATRERGPHAH